MAIPTTKIHVLRLLLQAEQNLSGLQRDMRNNALSWLASATAQNVPRATLAAWMNDAATSYQQRLAWLYAAQADTATWSQLGAMWTALGGTGQDFADMVTPLRAVADQLGPAAKGSYPAIINICNKITAAVNAPLSLWPE